MSFAGNGGFVLAFAVQEYGRGMTHGEYAVNHSAAVGDVTMGEIIAVIRRIHAGGVEDAYTSPVSLHILLSLGSEGRLHEKPLPILKLFAAGALPRTRALPGDRIPS